MAGIPDRNGDAVTWRRCRRNSARKIFRRTKGAKNPEAVIKLFNMHLEKNWGETAEFDYYYAPKEAESVWQLSR